jgi:hypothetical protein
MKNKKNKGPNFVANDVRKKIKQRQSDIETIKFQ